MFGSYKDSFRSLIQSRLSLGAFLTSWQNQDIQNEGTKMVAVWRSYRYRRVTVCRPQGNHLSINYIDIYSLL